MNHLNNIHAKTTDKSKKVLLFILFLPFLVLYVQQFKAFISLQPLKGYFIPTKYSTITLIEWLDGSYQKNTESYLNENFGFRSALVRLHNQIEFSVFKKTNTEKVCIGKEDYLYEIPYINAFYGYNVVEKKNINDSLREFKILQDTLKQLGKDILLVLAPGKARIYPEYIPDYYSPKSGQMTNYDNYVEALHTYKISYLDFTPLFLNKKSKSNYLLFPQLGMHWSRLEAVYAFDTIAKHLSYLSGNPTPKLVVKSVSEKKNLEPPDDDVAESMNLLRYPNFKKMGYPEFYFEQKNKIKKNCVVVSDSYWWDIYNQGLPLNAFQDNEFWYYFRAAYSKNHCDSVNSIDIKRRLIHSDFIIVLISESNLNRLGYNFFGSALSALRKPIIPTESEIKDITAAIKKNDDWYKDVQRKASEKKITVDSMLRLDATWFFQIKGPITLYNSFEKSIAVLKDDAAAMKKISEEAFSRKINADSVLKEKAVIYMITNLNDAKSARPFLNIYLVKQLINLNPEWKKNIEEKASTRKISVDSMMTMDALWYLQNN